jgi:hypothetical protein
MDEQPIEVQPIVRDATRPYPAERIMARNLLVGFAAVMTMGGIVFHLLVRGGLGQTAALYIGLPGLLAMGLALTPRGSGSATGMVVKGITILLLLSMPFLGEGFL